MEVRLGSHYLYHHGQDCCHVVVVGEVRFVSERWDVREGAVYPLEVYVRHERKRRCGACRLFASQYAVYDDMLCVDNPTFLCEHCYRRLHYDEEGTAAVLGLQSVQKCDTLRPFITLATVGSRPHRGYTAQEMVREGFRGEAEKKHSSLGCTRQPLR